MIHKLRNNIPLTVLDYAALEKIFTGELGTAEDYKREFNDTPFGLLVRKIAKLEYEAATAAFSEFINDESLNQGANCVRQKGYGLYCTKRLH